MHDIDLILTLTGGLTAALVCGYLTFRLGLSPIVGYLLAGLVVGPHTPGFVADNSLAGELAEIGIILLMFGVGLQFHLEELLAVRKVVVPGALVGSLVATMLGTGVGLAAGWSLSSAVIFGLAISVASTVVLLRVLADAGDLHTRAGHVAVGWLVVEDLLTVFVLVVLPAVFGGGGASGGLAGHPVLAVLLAVAKVGALVVLTLYGGGRLIPWVLARAAATRSRELFTLTVLVLALGIAVGSAKAFGVSMPLGAFLAGMVVGRSEFSLRAATEALPMRDAFAVLFFVSVGMLFDPRHLIRAPGLVAGTLAVILLGKPLAALVVVRLLGQPLRTSASVATALTQIGEFSFILAATGQGMGILDDTAVNTIVAAAIVSITLNPLYYRLAQADRVRPPTLHPGTRGVGSGGGSRIFREPGPRQRSRPRPRRGRRLWTGGPDARAAASGEPVRGCRHRAEPPDRAPACRRGDRGHLRRRHPPPDPGAGRPARRGRAGLHQLPDRWHDRGNPHSTRAEPAHAHRRQGQLSHGAAGAPPGGRRPRVRRRGRAGPLDDRVAARTPGATPEQIDRERDRIRAELVEVTGRPTEPVEDARRAEEPAQATGRPEPSTGEP